MTRMTVLALAALVAACAPQAKEPPLPSTTIDGISVTLDRRANPNYAALDVAGSRESWERHKEIGLQAAETLSGCTATYQPGTVLDYIAEGAKPVRIAVALAC